MDDRNAPTTEHAGWSSARAFSGQPASQPSDQYDPWAARANDTQPVYSPARPNDARPRRGTAFLVALALGAGLLGGAAGAGVVAVLDEDQATRPSSTTESSLDGSSSESNQSVTSFSSVEDVAAAVLPSVVSIAVQSGAGVGTGTGVIISSDGRILTNDHVVANATELSVTFHDGTTAEAEVFGTDPVTDLAVIQAQQANDLTPAEFGTSAELEVGQQVVAIGSPFGLEGTVTSGIVSAVGRPVTPGDQTSLAVIDAIQTDAPINPGNSGGPLVNMAGQVIGINSAIYSPSGTGSVGLGFAIPIDQARPIAEELIDTGRATHARIGIGLGPFTAETRGAVIASVEPGSGADDAGLTEGDVITKIDDRLVTDGTSLVAAARSYRPGDTVTLTYVRDGETQTTEVTLGSDADS